MGLGDIVRTMQVVPVVVWRKKAAGYSAPAAGDPVAFDSNGDLTIGLDTTDGPLAMLTTLNKTISSVVYYEVMIWGMGILKSNGAIVPNKFVAVDSTSKIIAQTTTVSAGFTQAEIQRLWRTFGMYLMKESDPATNDYAISNAAAADLIVVFVGRTP